ncbi:hypothetical protein HUT18_08070 [Streptomyces sp. NA04227]|uniref:hypothetical protein n=1 Tax=Streptomyces sp. NA04227 TaxID=2742136 RepID=UPI001590F8EF|nr:hypothetical protein [Streptomyces sp. NA04227]QKW06362.1 hypothetical protein HUT18_08070 [Streptomyces sp. NA04227]
MSEQEPKSKPAGPRPLTAAVSDDALRTGTGRGWTDWFAVLDDWDATERSHVEIARHLRERHGVGGWYAQTVTVGYEQERGLRAVGQGRDGSWSASVSKTIEASAARVIEAFADAGIRRAWLPEDGFTVRTHRPATSVTADFADVFGGVSRIDVRLTVVNADKTRLGVGHTKLPDAAAVATYKEFWRERLTGLKALLEQ